MYIPYRKAYISGMNPLSFVTVFTFGELGTTFGAGAAVRRRIRAASRRNSRARGPALFWLFLGGFCWVLGDLFQQYAAKYIGIGRGIPLSNTNQLWGLAWGALVFGELHGLGAARQALVVAGSLVMIAGRHRHQLRRSAGIGAVVVEARRWSASARATAWIPSASRPRCADDDPLAKERPGRRRWWELLVVAAAAGASSCGSAGAPNARPSP